MALLAVLATLLLAVPAPVSAAADRSERPGKHERPASAYAKATFASANHARTHHRRAELRKGGCLQRFASRQARRMAKADEMFHQDLSPILERCDLVLVGENVAFGFEDADAVVEAWLESPSHRDNLLAKQYQRMAVAARRAQDGTWYVAQVFGQRG